MLDTIILLFGISGVVVLSIAFMLEATDKLGKDHHLFVFMNLYATIGLLTYSWYNFVWLFVWLNLMMLIVNLYGLYKIYRN